MYVDGTCALRVVGLLLLLSLAIIHPEYHCKDLQTSHQNQSSPTKHSSFHAATQISIVHEPKHTTHPHASSSVDIAVHHHEEATIDRHVACSNTREQNSQSHGSEDGEDGNADRGAGTVEDQAEGLVELEEVVLLEEEGEGVSDDADEDINDGEHRCCEVGWIFAGDLMVVGNGAARGIFAMLEELVRS